MKMCKLGGGAVVRKETASLEQKIHQERLPSLQLGIMFGTHALKVFRVGLYYTRKCLFIKRRVDFSFCTFLVFSFGFYRTGKAILVKMVSLSFRERINIMLSSSRFPEQRQT